MDEKDFCEKLGAVLRAARTGRADGMSQYKLAELSGLTRRYVQMLESGKQGITLISLFYLAKALNISPARLVEELDSAITDGELPGSVLSLLPPRKAGRPKKT